LTAPQNRHGDSVSYLRLRSTAPDKDDAGLLIESVDVDVAEGR